MKIAILPQSSIRLVGKKFRALYPLVDRLNVMFELAATGNRIELLQIFFDTDVLETEGIQLLKLRDGILQVIQPFNWEVFSRLTQEQQKVKLLEYIQNIVRKVTDKYKLDNEVYEEVFKSIFIELSV